MEVCKEIIMKKIGEIKPYIRNPRKNDKTVELLVDIIPKVGFNVPIVIDNKGVIVKGHSRYKAAIKLGMNEVPCIISNADEEQIKLDRIADNRVSEFSEWLSEGLAHELDMLTLDFSNLEFNIPNTMEDMPSFEDFEYEEDVTNEEKQKRYEELLKQQEQMATPVQMTTQAELDRAMRKQTEVPTAPKQYYKCICEKCGHIMFVDKDKMISMQEE